MGEAGMEVLMRVVGWSAGKERRKRVKAFVDLGSPWCFDSFRCYFGCCAHVRVFLSLSDSLCQSTTPTFTTPYTPALLLLPPSLQCRLGRCVITALYLLEHRAGAGGDGGGQEPVQMIMTTIIHFKSFQASSATLLKAPDEVWDPVFFYHRETPV